MNNESTSDSESSDNEERAEVSINIIGTSDGFLYHVFRLFHEHPILNGMFGNLINEHPNPRDNEKELPKLLRSMARSTDEINSNVQEYIGNATPTIEQIDECLKDNDLQRESGQKLIQQIKDAGIISEKIKTQFANLNSLLSENKEAWNSILELAQPTTLPNFTIKWDAILSKNSVREYDGKLRRNCIVCFENTVDSVLHRNCSDRRYKCEDTECNCGPIICKSCLTHHFWVQSENGKKSYARCPHCRAEFCMYDIHAAVFKNTETGEKSEYKDVEMHKEVIRPLKERAAKTKAKAKTSKLISKKHPVESTEKTEGKPRKKPRKK